MRWKKEGDVEDIHTIMWLLRENEKEEDFLWLMSEKGDSRDEHVICNW